MFSFSGCMGFTSSHLLYKIKSIYNPLSSLEFIHAVNQCIAAHTSIALTYLLSSSTDSDARKITVSLCSSSIFLSILALTFTYTHLVLIFVLVITSTIFSHNCYSPCHRISTEQPSMFTIFALKYLRNSSSVSIEKVPSFQWSSHDFFYSL